MTFPASRVGVLMCDKHFYGFVTRRQEAAEWRPIRAETGAIVLVQESIGADAAGGVENCGIIGVLIRRPGADGSAADSPNRRD